MSDSTAPLYVALILDRFLGGVNGMTTEEIGAFVLLIVEQAVKGWLPNNPRRLAAIARMDPGAFSTAWNEALSQKFEAISPDDPTRLVSPRMAIEREIALGQSAKQSDRATTGWETRRRNAAACAAAYAAAMPPQTQTQTKTQTQAQTRASGGDRIGVHTGATDLAAWCTTEKLDTNAFFELERHFLALGQEAETKGIPPELAYRSMRSDAEDCLDDARTATKTETQAFGKWKRMLLGTGATDLAGRFRAAMKHHSPEVAS